MDDPLSPNDQTGNPEMGNSGAGDSGRGGNNAGARGGSDRGGRVNTSAWLIGLLVVIVAVFAGLRFARVPAPSRPAPTRPTPTRPAPTQPVPAAPSPTVADLDRNVTRTEDAISRRDWTTADKEAATLRTSWQSLRARVTSTDTTKDVTTFDSRLDKLMSNIRAKNESGARADITELKSLAKRFKLSPTRGPTTG